MPYFCQQQEVERKQQLKYCKCVPHAMQYLKSSPGHHQCVCVLHLCCIHLAIARPHNRTRPHKWYAVAMCLLLMLITFNAVHVQVWQLIFKMINPKALGTNEAYIELLIDLDTAYLNSCRWLQSNVSSKITSITIVKVLQVCATCHAVFKKHAIQGFTKHVKKETWLSTLSFMTAVFIANT